MISVIVPIYNVEQYLRRCVDSILNQTYRDIEIILVDDGSTDGSGTICDEYAEKDSRIRVIHKHNGGISSGRNRGLDIACGEYISFIDSDDWVEPDFLETLLNLLQKHDADISVCSFLRESPDIKDEQLQVARFDSTLVLEGRDIFSQLFDSRTALRTILVWNKLYKRWLWEDRRFPEGVVFEDEAFAHEILYNARRMVFNDSTLYHYMWRPDSISIAHRQHPQKFLDLVSAREKRLAFFQGKGEEEYFAQTLPKYFNALIRAGSAYYYSDVEDKNRRLQEIITKINENLEAFSKNRFMGRKYRLILMLYRISPILGFQSCEKLTAAQDGLKRLTK